MNYFKSIIVSVIVLYCTYSHAQTDFEYNELKLTSSLSFNSDPFSIYTLGKVFDLPEVDIFEDKFSKKRPEIDMVAAANKKAYRAQQQQEQSFSFIERQSAIFSRFQPKFDNSANSIYSPSYHQQPIYSDLNRVKNSAYEDLGDKYNRFSPFFQLSPYRRGNGSGFYFYGN
jgi:hypothetical protein